MSNHLELDVLQHFQLDRVLNDDPIANVVILLGKFPKSETPDASAIIRIEKTSLAFSAESLCSSLQTVKLIESTDIYTWLFGWMKPSEDRPDVKINVIYPATEVHIRKYSNQQVIMVRETPELFKTIVKPYIAAFPPARVQWVYNILSGASEAEKVLYKDPSPEFGYIILPDMKWDLTTIPSLYLVAIILSKDVTCLRDLRKRHLGMLRSIRRESARIVKEKWGLEEGSLRLFIHYQPSYYHFHVHIVNANYIGTMGSTVGQAYLLDHIISLLTLDKDDHESILEQLTFTYGLGEQHGLFAAMKAAQPQIEDDAT